MLEHNEVALRGILLRRPQDAASLHHFLRRLGVDQEAFLVHESVRGSLATLEPKTRVTWTPGGDTLDLRQRLDWTDPSDHALELEIVVSMLAAPIVYEFADVASLASHIRVRRHIAQAAAESALSFKTATAERPTAWWTEDPEHGFVLRAGRDLVDALEAATQPEITGQAYGFSCYRATEYVILLGIARELRDHHPVMYEQLRRRCEQQVIRSGRFHDVFLVEHGSLADPLPMRYYVPGDRVWFRNPDAASSDASGYEGSWTIYLGGGHFANFWELAKPYTLEGKCLEVYFWRDAVYLDAEGDARIDEERVMRMCADAHEHPDREATIIASMMRLRDPQGVYAEGGCIDATREVPRGVSLQHCELLIPAFEDTPPQQRAA
jgi:hypothetical protein